jgi:hypothetical protein
VQTPSTCGDGLIIGSTNSINRKFASPMTLVFYDSRLVSHVTVTVARLQKNKRPRVC